MELILKRNFEYIPSTRIKYTGSIRLGVYLNGRFAMKFVDHYGHTIFPITRNSDEIVMLDNQVLVIADHPHRHLAQELHKAGIVNEAMDKVHVSYWYKENKEIRVGDFYLCSLDKKLYQWINEVRP